MDAILQRLDAIRWVYSNGAPDTVAKLSRRIAEIGRTPDQFLTYSKLVAGVTFNLPNVNNGRPFEIEEWTNLERAIHAKSMTSTLLNADFHGAKLCNIPG